MLEIDGLEVRSGDFVLRDIHLRVEEGSCHAVLGPSGSGKSTLIRALLGALPVDRGAIRLAGAELGRRPMEERRLGYVPQQLGLFPHLTVRDNLLFGLRAQGLPLAPAKPHVDRLIEITGIGALLERRPDTLSGGERQRVALARALAPQPRAVLLDEPFSALDTSLRRELGRLVMDLQERQGLTVLLVTHDLEEAFLLADQVTVLIEGRQEQSGVKGQVYRQPASLAVARFLGLRNLYEARVLSAGDGRMRAACPALGTELQLAQGQADGRPAPAPGAIILLGIRPEQVNLRDEDHPARGEECVLVGRVHLLDRGESVLLSFIDERAGTAVEVVASHRLVERFALHDGAGPVRIGIDPASLFWVPRP
ncbi:MAG: ABC transporter ATP-binding protein [bacterium]|nr:ABC transporter ATP-binding protein [bacterium]